MNKHGGYTKHIMYRPMVTLTAFTGLVLEKTNTASSCVSLHFLNFVIAIIYLGNVYQSAAGEITLFTLRNNCGWQCERNLIGLQPAAKEYNSESDCKSEL